VSECALCLAEDLDYFDEDEDGYLSEDSLDPDDMTYEVCCGHIFGPTTAVHMQPQAPAVAPTPFVTMHAPLA
jgi:hypothetical protein